MHQSLADGREQRGPPGAQGSSALLEASLLVSPLSLPGVRCGAWQQKVSQGKRGSSRERLQTMNEAVHGHAAKEIGQRQQKASGEAVSAGPFAAGDRGQRQGPPPLAEPVLVIQQPNEKTANARVLLQQYDEAQATGLSLLNGAAVLLFVKMNDIFSNFLKYKVLVF